MKEFQKAYHVASGGVADISNKSLEFVQLFPFDYI